MTVRLQANPFHVPHDHVNECFALFCHTYARNRSTAYSLWALALHFLLQPEAPPPAARPCWLASQANRLAAWVRDQLHRSAPIWPGNNTRGEWHNSPADRFCRLMAQLTVAAKQELVERILTEVLRTEPILNPVPLPARVPAALLLQLLRQPTAGVFQQGVIFGLASIYYGRMGWTTRTRHVCCADRQTGAWGDIELSDLDGLRLVLEVTDSRLTARRLRRLKPPACPVFVLARRLPETTPAMPPSVRAWTLDHYAEFLLAHFDEEDRRAALDVFVHDFLCGIAKGAHYGRLRAFFAEPAAMPRPATTRAAV